MDLTLADILAPDFAAHDRALGHRRERDGRALTAGASGSGSLRQLTDHSTFMAPYNVLAYLFSAVPNQPYLDVAQLPDLAPLRDNWRDDPRGAR